MNYKLSPSDLTYLGEKEIYKFIKDVRDVNQNILLIIDGEKSELPEIMDTYSDTWGKVVKLLMIKKFSNKEDYVFMVEPEFERIEFAPEESIDELEQTDYYSEEFHLDGISYEIKGAYFKIKEELLKKYSDLKFNPQKYYISIASKRNLAFFLFRKKKLRIVIMLLEEEIKRNIICHKVKSLSKGVQKFFNGPCAEVVIENDKKLGEVIGLIKTLISANK